MPEFFLLPTPRADSGVRRYCFTKAGMIPEENRAVLKRRGFCAGASTPDGEDEADGGPEAQDCGGWMWVGRTRGSGFPQAWRA